MAGVPMAIGITEPPALIGELFDSDFTQFEFQQ
jgi:hypothetical protein